MNCHSKLLNENFVYNEDVSVVFESGVEYTLDELSILSDAPKSDVVELHRFKQMFEGEIIVKSHNKKIVNVKTPYRQSKLEYTKPVHYTLGGYNSETAYNWTCANKLMLNTIISKLENIDLNEKQSGIEFYIELRSHFMFDKWIDGLTVFNECRSDANLKSLETLLVLAEIAIDKSKLPF